MLQSELAKLLDISPAMVSRLAKRGMPTDTVERAQRWRKRHLEPGRVKGSRFDPLATKPTPAKSSPTPPKVLTSDVEAAGLELDLAMANGDQTRVAAMLQKVRDMLRKMHIKSDPEDEAEPRLSLRVWVALCAYVLNLNGVIEQATTPGELLTPVQFCRHWRPDWPTYPLENHHTLNHACDWGDIALNGWPQYPDDPEWVAMMAEV